MRNALASGAILIAMGLSGCGKSGDTRSRLPTTPVSGKLHVDGQPFGPCIVYLAAAQNEADPKRATPTVTGRVQADGSFQLSTYEPGDGAPAGTYHVSLGGEASSMLVPIPICKPIDVVLQESQKTLDLNLEGTGATQSGPPIGQGMPHL